VFSNPPTFQIYDPAVISPNDPNAYAVDPNTLDPAKLRTLTGATSRDMTKRKQPWLQSLETSLRDGAIRRLRERAMLDKQTFDPATAPEELIAGEVMALRQDLKKMGINELAYVDETFEIVCEELCGGGHSLMTGQMIVVSGEQYDRFINKQPPGEAPAAPVQATQPTTAATTAPATQAASGK
jgi:hypothetical protein